MSLSLLGSDWDSSEVEGLGCQMSIGSGADEESVNCSGNLWISIGDLSGDGSVISRVDSNVCSFVTVGDQAVCEFVHCWNTKSNILASLWGPILVNCESGN